MRVFSYILTAFVTIFVLNVALSFSLPSYRNALVTVRSSIFPSSATIEKDDKEEQKRLENARLVESLDRIDKHIESLSETKKTEIETITLSGMTNAGKTYINSTLSGISVPEEETAPKESVIPLSWLFLSKIMPEVMPKRVDNNGFFSIQVMEKILYSTYSDDKKKVKIYAFKDTYDTILLNMKLASKVYIINETDQFFGYTFFLNPLKKDPKNTTVRFITALEGQAIGVEVSKEYYGALKKMLLKNK